MKYAKDFRLSARNALKGKWWEAVAAGLIASMLGAVSSSGGSFSISLPSGGQSSGDSVDQTVENLGPEFWATFLTIFGIIFAVGLVVGIAFLTLGSIVSAGYSKFNLDLIDGNRAEIGTLFKYFPNWKTLVSAGLLRAVFVFLWSLLFIIPGIIARYNYAMVPYILAEEPTIAPKEALEKSKQMMYGNRWRLFCLEISFIGWALLVGLTCGIGGLWLTPYQQAAFADFYREISDTRPEPEIEIEIVEEAEA